MKEHSADSPMGESRVSSQSKTTIELSMETRNRLKALGRKGETYDQIIKKLLRLTKQAT
ncbi:MAG: hypothetical protein WED04_06165 [Promethearchaeati archaeon SRVP18_Atabeyarchaeia-1]